jgi:hypothetical protein
MCYAMPLSRPMSLTSCSIPTAQAEAGRPAVLAEKEIAIAEHRFACV